VHLSLPARLSARSFFKDKIVEIAEEQGRKLKKKQRHRLVGCWGSAGGQCHWLDGRKSWSVQRGDDSDEAVAPARPASTRQAYEARM
jgi:hypothetical protein